MYNDILFEYELGVQKLDHMFESATDRFNIAVMELSMLANQGYIKESEDSIFTEAVSEYTEKIKKFFTELIEKVKKLVKEIKNKMHVKMVQKDVNKKLEQMKKTLANNKAIYNGKTVKLFDTKKYLKEYTVVINTLVAELKKLYSKEHTNVDEYEREVDKLNKKMNKLVDKFMITNDESWYISVAVNEAIVYTENECKNIESIQNAYEKAWIDAIESMMSLAENEDDATKVTDIKKQTSKFSAACSKVFNTISQHPIKSTATLSAVLSAAATKLAGGGGEATLAAAAVGGVSGAIASSSSITINKLTERMNKK